MAALSKLQGQAALELVIKTVANTMESAFRNLPRTLRDMKRHAEEYQAKNILIEDKASGTQLIQDLKADGLQCVTRYDPKSMDKVMRMNSVTSTIENGFVHIPAQAGWLSQYLHEMAVFPNGKYDDQVDSTSQALDWSKDGAGAIRLAYVEYVLEQLETRGPDSPESLREEEMAAYRMMVRRARMGDRGW